MWSPRYGSPQSRFRACIRDRLIDHVNGGAATAVDPCCLSATDNQRKSSGVPQELKVGLFSTAMLQSGWRPEKFLQRHLSPNFCRLARLVRLAPQSELKRMPMAHSIFHGDACFAWFKIWESPSKCMRY
jgi:hypothetical protein